MLVDLPDARDTAHPCRPTISCTADIVEPGRLEAEAGALVSHVDAGPARVLSFPFLLKQSFTRMLQLQVGSNGYTRVDALPETRYFDDVFVGPKLHLRDQDDSGPSLALSAQVAFPVSSAEGYTRHDDASLTGFASKDVGWVHLDWNVGALAWGLEGSPALQGFAALALSPTSSPAPLGGTVEVYYFSDAAPVAPHDGGVRICVQVTARPWLVFDVGTDTGFFPATREYSMFLGVTVIPVVFWRPEGAGAAR